MTNVYMGRIYDYLYSNHFKSYFNDIRTHVTLPSITLLTNDTYLLTIHKIHILAGGLANVRVPGDHLRYIKMVISY